MSEIVIEFVQNSSKAEDMRLFRGRQQKVPSNHFVKQPLAPSDSEFNSLITNQRPVDVKLAGDKLQQQLAAHSDINTEWNSLLRGSTKVPSDFALQIQLGADKTDGLPWEALYDTQSNLFLNMDSRWPISRTAMIGETSITRGLDEGELKILAVLTAAGSDASSQWDAIQQAAQTGAGSFSTRIKVIYGQDTLKTYIEQQQQNVTVDFEPLVDEWTVYDALKEFQPHLVHLFGHGDNQGGPRIEFATASDHLGGHDGSVEIEPAQILSTLETSESAVWAVAALACLTANPNSSGNSFARDLISLEVPVAIGMREKVDMRALNKFAEEWYDQLAQQLIQATQSNTLQQFELNWRGMMLEGRRGILESTGQGKSTRVQGDYPEWSFPVLWESEAQFFANVDTSISDAARSDREASKRFRQKSDDLMS